MCVCGRSLSHTSSFVPTDSGPEPSTVGSPVSTSGSVAGTSSTLTRLPVCFPPATLLEGSPERLFLVTTTPLFATFWVDPCRRIGLSSARPSVPDRPSEAGCPFPLGTYRVGRRVSLRVGTKKKGESISKSL